MMADPGYESINLNGDPRVASSMVDRYMPGRIHVKEVI